MASDSKTPRLRWIPINEIPLHDRPAKCDLRAAAVVLRDASEEAMGDEGFRAVAAWLDRVSNIPEDPK